MDKIDRIMEITDRYLERFGRALIGIYYLPPLAENWKFTVFINSLQVTLRRMDLMPGYCAFFLLVQSRLDIAGAAIRRASRGFHRLQHK